MTGPNFYTIDFAREVVLQGKSTTFITIGRNDVNLLPTEELWAIVMPNTRTFNSYFSGGQSPVSGFGSTALQVSLNSPTDYASPDTLSFNNVQSGMDVKNSWDFKSGTVRPGPTGLAYVSNTEPIQDITPVQKLVTLRNQNTASLFPNLFAGDIHLGEWDNTGKNRWKLNGKTIGEYESIAYTEPPSNQDVINLPNIFDGSVEAFPAGILTGTGYVSRNPAGWIKVVYDVNQPGASATLRIDYDGSDHSHMKFNIIVFKRLISSSAANIWRTPLNLPTPAHPNSSDFVDEDFGAKSGNGSIVSNYLDYQEVHFFGYKEAEVRTSRTTYQNEFKSEAKIYDDRASYSLLKTNPKISGNVKITLDSTGNLWLNSIDANNELADSAYKKYPVSPLSTYSRDLYKFFKNGQTPTSIIFDLFQVDNLYQNTKRNLYEQYDNFYNYGVEQLKSKYYDENFSFFAPLWLRKNVPDFFIIFRLDHPISIDTYKDASNPAIFESFFKDSRIVKTFDMREKSQLGGYLRKITTDPRFKERPLDVSFDNDIATTWNGVSYADGTMTGKGEFLYDYWKQDRPIIELEEYITGGYQRHGILSTNLMNLEFLFDDEEATPYSINRYFGLYVTENQLANFEIDPAVLGKITGQTPAPKPGVDGQPYSTKPFIQSNPNGIELPVHYYHNPTSLVNNTNVPTYQGPVVGKFPLPSFVDDPLRIFYVKDRDDVFKRISKLSEVDYGNPGTSEYRRVSQLKLFDNSEDISKYAGVNQITSQFSASLLDKGSSQLRLHLSKQDTSLVFADEEVIELTVNQYNSDPRNHQYKLNIKSSSPTSVTFNVFKDQFAEVISAFSMPAVGTSININVNDGSKYTVGQLVYVTGYGNFIVSDVIINILGDTIDIENTGGIDNVPYLTVLTFDQLISTSRPTYESTYNFTPFTNDLTIDPILTLEIVQPLSFIGDESYDIEIKDTEVSFNQLGGSTSPPIFAKASKMYEQFRWKMVANQVGLPAGSAWAYPIADPNGYDYVTTFSNEGTETQVATALAAAINSFENRPCNATVIDDVIYLKATRPGLEGDNIQLTRNMVNGKSNVFNLGFYERSNVNINYDINVISATTPAPVRLIAKSAIAGSSYTYISVYKQTTGIEFKIGENVDPTNFTTAATSGVQSSIITLPNLVEFTDSDLAFGINVSQLSLNVYHEFIIETIVGPLSVTQLFVGGSDRNRNRARIGSVDSERYFSDRRVKLTANIITGSNVLSNVPLTEYNLYVGASIKGDGIPANSYVKEIDYVSDLLYISNPATLGTPAIPATQTSAAIPAVPYTTNITVGDLSILNNTSIRDQWYQTQKGLYSPMVGWEVQGKYVYSLPNLEEPIYDSRNNISDYKNLGEYSIIQIEDINQEFYQTTDKRIVAYNIYRPILGMFSIFPIKEFDFDFNFSDYSYTPILEAFRYYFNEKVNAGSSVILPSGENYKITPLNSQGEPMHDTLSIKIEGLNPDTKNWDYLEDIVLNKDVLTTSGFEPYVINTYYPFYVYDVKELPQIPGDAVNYFISGSGKRNYMRRNVSSINKNGEVTEKTPLSFRLTIATTLATAVNIVKNDYYEDKDLKSFQGFSAITDLYSPEDAIAVRGLLDDEKYVDAFLYQSLRSEYDRLRENFNKDYALRSRVVPYITKWVQEGTDARDNYYRLDNSKAFGITNFSPDTNVNFAEPSLLTNEFPYLDTVPKDYPAESLEGSRSYMFAKLNDIAKGDSTWIDLLTSNDDDDWFTKYFALGYPTEISQEGDNVPKSRDERYTFMIYNEGLKRAQTIFRGSKIQVLDINSQLIPPTEITESTKYNDYKFASIARIVPYDPYFVEPINTTFGLFETSITKQNNGKTQKPIDIEIYRNDKFKSITMIITVRVQDYRVQAGLNDYLFLYAVKDQLKNYNQTQTQFNSRAANTFGYNTVLSITDFIPYDPTASSPSYTDFAVMRSRQGFFGGGYLELGDTRLGGLIYENSVSMINRPSWDAVGKTLTLKYKSVDPTYNFSVLNEIIPTADEYINKTNVFSGTSLLNVVPTSYTKAGSIFKLITAAKTPGNKIVHITHSDSRLVNDQYLPDQTIFGSQKQPMISIITPGEIALTSEFKVALNPIYPYYTSAICEMETYNIKGGTQTYVNIKNLLTYASIKQFINSDSSFIEYYKVVGNKKLATLDYKLRMIEPDQIIKTGVLAYVNDEDKPIEYLSTATIGYNIVNTDQNEVVYRHRGSYEPRANDILSFWVREDENFTNHFNKDYLLFNTHFNDKSPQSGFLRNYGINKVSDAEVLKIKSGGAYKSVYPLIGEISVDIKEIFTLNSTWDKNYYRKYYDTTSWNDLDGIEEMQEFKSFLGSKAMNIPKTQLLDTFNSDEAISSVLEPAEVVGVKLLSKKVIKSTDVQGNTKPILTIDLNIKERLLRKLYEDINLPTSFDEFTWLTTLGIVNFDGLNSTDIERLKKEYLLKNILQLYTISEIKLYALSKEGIPLFDITIDDGDKIAAGYRVDKDCKVVNVSEWDIRITKQLDTKKPFGYAVSATIKRI